MLAKHKTHHVKGNNSLSFEALLLIIITMAKKHSKANQSKRLKLEAYRQNISLSELKRVKSAGDGEERTSPLPHGDIIVLHESCNDAVLQQDALQEDEREAVAGLARVSVSPAQLEALVAQEGAVLREDIENLTPPTKRARVSPEDKENATTPPTKRPLAARAQGAEQEGAAQSLAAAQEGAAPAQAVVQEGVAIGMWQGSKQPESELS